MGEKAEVQKGRHSQCYSACTAELGFKLKSISLSVEMPVYAFSPITNYVVTLAELVDPSALDFHYL